MINHRNAPLIVMKIFFYITSLLFTCIYTENVDKSASKLLSLSSNSNNNKIDYYTSYYYSFLIDDYDDIDIINISPNTITISTHLNETLVNLDINNLDLNIAKNGYILSYDIPSNWNKIYESALSNINIEYSSRRRLGWWNKAKIKGRYVADGISRRFKDAKNYCRHIYGDLASIMSKEEEEKVKDLCAKWNLGNCWIGYEKPWGHWSDGRRPTFLHWKAGEPNNYGGSEGCAEISSSGLWNDIKCSRSRIAICERPRIHVVGHYVAVMRNLNWRDANKRCQELFSTDLATIENARENIMVRRACSALDSKIDCWIGLKRPFKTWQDGIDAKIQNFADDEPNNAGGNENCVAIMESQRWKDSNCAEGHYFVCNTITQDVRVKKRAEAKRRRQEKEKELEKKRKKMEDQIMNRYMQQNQNSMMGKMTNGQGLYGSGGIGSQQGKMSAFGMGGQQMGGRQKTYEMGGQQMYQMRGLGQVSGGQPNQHRMGYHNGLDTGGGGGANIGGSQMDGLYGSLGALGSGSNGQGGWTHGKPLQIQLVSGQYNGGGGGMGMGRYGQQQQQGYNNNNNNNNNGGFRFRRRMQIDIHENEWNMDEIYGSKCKIIGNNQVCIGHNYIHIKKYMKSIRKQKNVKRLNKKFEALVVGNNSNHNNNNEFGDFNNDDYVNYILCKGFVYDINDENKQCFEYYNNYKLCMKTEGIFSINNNEDNVFDYMNDNNWDYIEKIYKNNNILDNIIMNKCIYIYSGDINTKICIQQTENKNDKLILYKANVQFVAVSGYKENLNYQI